MGLGGPTTLHRPVDALLPAGGGQALGWFLVAVPVLAVAVWFGMRRHRFAQRHPREHAFRALSRRMGLGAREMRAVRAYAQNNGGLSPIGVLMDADRLDEALGRG